MCVASGTTLIAGSVAYLMSVQNHFASTDSKDSPSDTSLLKPDERTILYLASLVPSVHNTQPWFVKYIEPYHWIICNDKNKWLPAVDPTQRETSVSIGAFIQNLDYAAGNTGYNCQFDMIASTNQDENIVEVKLTKSGSVAAFDSNRIKNRRTVRSKYDKDPLRKKDAND